MTTWGAALHQDSNGRLTSSSYGDRGDGVNDWFLPVRQIGLVPGYPVGATPLRAASGNVANASAAATLGGASSVLTYITGFTVTAAGATAAANVSVTVAGVTGGTMTYTFTAPAGATVAAQPLIVQFPAAIPASATNTAIVVTCPALGSGNTHASVTATGYRL